MIAFLTKDVNTIEYLTLQARCHINLCRYNRVQLCYFSQSFQTTERLDNETDCNKFVHHPIQFTSKPTI
jgi:hypothetical protein